MTKSRSLLITGMHRSGTSLVASVLRHAGVDLGSDLLGPAAGNPRGHFEDKDFLALQQGWLDRADLDILVRDRRQIPELSAEDREAAAGLVAVRAEKPLWGFKDPRSALFLDLWHGLLPDPRYVVIYRHPLDVALSLDRRGSDLAAVADPRISLRSWCVHNRAALDFVRRHRRHCFVADVQGVVADLSGFVERVADGLELELDTEADFSRLFAPVELHSATDRPGVDTLLADLLPEVAEVYHELAGLADLPATAAEPESTRPSPRGERLERLERLVEGWNADLVDDRTRRPWLTLLMALLDPEETDRVEEALARHLENFASHRRHARNLERELERVREEAEGHHDAVSRLEASLAEKIADREALATHTVGLEGRLAEQAEDLRSLSAYSAKLEDEVAEKTGIHRGLELELSQTRDYLGSIEQHASNLEALVQERLERAAELERHSANLESELETARGRVVELEGHATHLETERLGELERHSSNLELELGKARERVADLEDHVSRLESVKVGELERHASNLQSELGAAQRRITELEEHTSNLESERDRLVTEGSRGDAGSADRLAGRVEELEHHAANLETELGRSRERASELDRHAANLERLRSELEGRVVELEAHTTNLERLVSRPADSSRQAGLSDASTEPAVE